VLPLHPIRDFISITFAKDSGNVLVAPALEDLLDITPRALPLAPAHKFALSRVIDKAGIGEAGGLEGAECTHHGQGSKILMSLSTPDAAVAHALWNGGRVSKLMEHFKNIVLRHANVKLKPLVSSISFGIPNAGGAAIRGSAHPTGTGE
jgi:hypothetical protein